MFKSAEREKSMADQGLGLGILILLTQSMRAFCYLGDKLFI